VQRLNVAFYEAFELGLSGLEALGLPLAVAAWLTVFGGAIALGLVLRRLPMRGSWIPSLAVGAVALAAHLIDYLVTLGISPDLAMEGNPIWRVVIDRYGPGVARLYGLTGKLLLAILSFELYAFYTIQREDLFPARADSIGAFWRGFGRSRRRPAVRWANLVSAFAFCFALTGPFFFYVALLNLAVEHPVYLRMPSLPLALVFYVGGLVLAYLTATYRAYRRTRRVVPAT
jgi:hypothetical protein